MSIRLAIMLPLLGCCVGAIAQTRFVPLGDLPGGHFSSASADVSQDGKIVVGDGKRTTGLSEQEAFVWGDGAGMIGLGDLPGGIDGSTAAMISRDYSTIIGAASSSLGYEACYWSTQDFAIHSIGDLPGGKHNAFAYGVSNDAGVIVGAAQGPKGQRAFVWRRDTGVMQDLGTLPNTLPKESAEARAVSADGRVVVGTSSSGSGGTEAFVWTAETGMVGLGKGADDTYTDAFSITPDAGFIIGGTAIRRPEGNHRVGYRWSEEQGIVLLDTELDDFDSPNPIAVSLDGRTIIGNTIVQPDGDETFIWREGVGMMGLESYLKSLGLDVRSMGYSLHFVSGMSDDGRFIVGQATNPDGHGEAFLIEIPAPPAASLVALAAFVAVRRRR